MDVRTLARWRVCFVSASCLCTSSDPLPLPPSSLPAAWPLHMSHSEEKVDDATSAPPKPKHQVRVRIARTSQCGEEEPPFPGSVREGGGGE